MAAELWREDLSAAECVAVRALHGDDGLHRLGGAVRWGAPAIAASDGYQERLELYLLDLAEALSPHAVGP